jgi:hypothetical protein
MDSKWTPKRILLFILAGYLCANVVFFVLNPFSSPWHYHGHKPQPIPVTLPEDASLSLPQLKEILDEIDLAYRGRAATADEETARTRMRIVALVFLPADFALQMKEFIGYMGPATAEQQAFTLSVKRRYNHLARLAIAKGMEREGYFFKEDVQARKSNGQPFQSTEKTFETPARRPDRKIDPFVPTDFFRLKTIAQEADNRCLESNRVSPTSYLGGATFMDKCQNVSGQLWKAISAGNDTFRLTSLFLERDGMCLEGSVPFKAGDRLKGAARMESCANSPGQLWRVTKHVDGFIQLTNTGSLDPKRCLEGSTPEKTNDPLKGAARMEPCNNSADQMWRLIPQN